MTDDRLSGSAKNIGGQVEEGFGQVTGDVKTQLQGRAKQMEGTLQDVYGQAKETAADAAEAIRGRASEASDFLRMTIEERPYMTAAIALGIDQPLSARAPIIRVEGGQAVQLANLAMVDCERRTLYRAPVTRLSSRAAFVRVIERPH